MGVIQRGVRRIGHTALFAAIMKHVAHRVDLVVNKLTGGRKTAGGILLPTFVLVHAGAKSGKTYETPLAFVPLEDDFAIAGSNFGQLHNPAWTYNLLSNPDCEVVFDGQTIPVHARHVSDEEKAQLWPRFVEMWPAYNTYEARASHRDIKVFRLTRR